jgi:hypothetical protein
MPLNGLPSTLEKLLQPLFEENSLSSFKIECHEKKTVVVLRLTSLSESKHGASCEKTTFHRKRPAQVARDKKRAEMYRTVANSKTMNGDSSVSGVPVSRQTFSTSSPMPNFINLNSRNSLESDDFKSKPGHVNATAREDREESGVSSLGVTVSDIDLPSTTGSPEDFASKTETSPIPKVDNSSQSDKKQFAKVNDDYRISLYHKTFCYQCKSQRCFYSTAPEDEELVTNSEMGTSQGSNVYRPISADTDRPTVFNP